MNNRRRIVLFLFCFIGCFQIISAEGFVAGTLVKTQHGFIPVEQLHVNDVVVCFDLIDLYTTQPINHISTEIIDSYVHFELADTCLDLAPDQLLYTVPENQWVKAGELLINQKLLAHNNQQVPITNIQIINKSAEVYKISIAQYHTLYISSGSIIAHNFFPLIALGIGFACGTGAVECTLGITAGIGILGSVIGFAASKQIGKNKSNITPTINSIGSCTPGGSPQDPKKRNDDKYENMYEVFKRSPIGKKLQEAVEATQFTYKNSSKIFKAIKDITEYGIKEGDWLYLDKMHGDHIEVFKKCGKAIRTVLNMDGTTNAAKLAKAAGRNIYKWIR